MKKLLTIFLLLFTAAVFAQKKPAAKPPTQVPPMLSSIKYSGPTNALGAGMAVVKDTVFVNTNKAQFLNVGGKTFLLLPDSYKRKAPSPFHQNWVQRNKDQIIWIK